MSARSGQQTGRRPIGTFLMVVMAAVTVPVLAITLFVLLDISAEIFTAVEPIITGIGDATSSDITDGTGNGFSLFATIGLLSIPGAVLLKLLVGGETSALSEDPPNPPRSGGPPF